MLGLIILFVAFALVVGWVGKTAQERGRNAMMWGGIATIAGLVGFGLGFGVIGVALDPGRDASLAATMLMALSPAVLMLAPTIGIGVALQRSGFAKSRKSEWAVHILQHGPGTLRIETDRVVLAWADGSRDVPRHEVKHVEADGECVRVRVHDADADVHYAMLPMANGLNPAGRRDLSRQIAQRLVTR